MIIGDYLSSADKPTERVRCPVHGFIKYSKNERAIIDRAVFQRLRYIRQLAMTYLVYPGAMHSRFEHSLGVMELASQAFDSVALKRNEALERDLKQVPEFKSKTISKARQLVRLMALLHDVGHFAFSHAAEGLIAGGSHEAVSAQIIKEVLGEKIDSMLFDGAADLLCRLLQGSEEFTFLRQFVAGEMDMDRCDYLRRDSLHCGVSYGVFDSARLIESLTAVENPDSGRLQLAVERGGEHTFEALILARYQMGTQVYFHKIRRIYDHYLKEYVKLWGKGRPLGLEQVLQQNDSTMLAEIQKDAAKKNARGILAKRITDRRHHKIVFETGDNADRTKLQEAKRLLTKLQEHFDTLEFYLDDKSIPIHKLSVPGDQEEKVEEIYVVEKNGRRKLLAHESAIISKIPKSVRTVRIFVDADDRLRKQIEEKMKTLEKAL